MARIATKAKPARTVMRRNRFESSTNSIRQLLQQTNFELAAGLIKYTTKFVPLLVAVLPWFSGDQTAQRAFQCGNIQRLGNIASIDYLLLTCHCCLTAVISWLGAESIQLQGQQATRLSGRISSAVEEDDDGQQCMEERDYNYLNPLEYCVQEIGASTPKM